MKFKLLNRVNDNRVTELRLWEKLDGGMGKEVGEGVELGEGAQLSDIVRRHNRVVFLKLSAVRLRVW